MTDYIFDEIRSKYPKKSEKKWPKSATSTSIVQTASGVMVLVRATK